MAILIIETGLPPGDIPSKCGTAAQWFLKVLEEIGKKADVVRPYLGEELPPPVTVSGAIITGAWEMVTDHLDWSEKTAEWIRQAFLIDIPLFGVCYGHQLMAYALGGEVGRNPAGGEKGTFSIKLNETGKKNPLMQGFPSEFPAYLFHEQSVLKKPAGCEVLGGSEKDGCQILRYGTSFFSVQFHPEFTEAVVKAAHEDDQAKNGPSECRIAHETPWSRRLLQNFCRMVEDIG